MKVAALFSGGKDSAYAIWIAMQQGHEVTQLISFQSENPSSYMFHHPNIGLTALQAKAAGIPHRLVKTKGEKELELDDVRSALSGLKVDGIVSGAIASDYQKSRVDAICAELGFKSIAPLWHIDQVMLAKEEAVAMDSIIVSVSAEGLGKEWLGRKYDAKCVDELIKLNTKYGVSVVGEGGEFETLVLNAPFFNARLTIQKAGIAWRGTSGIFKVLSASLSTTP